MAAKTVEVKILDIKPITHDVKRFVVEKPKEYEFIPGQATEVAISKPGWTDKKRPFTFTCLNDEPNLEFIIKAYPLDKYPNHSGVTEQIHKLSKGDELIIGEPWGTINYQGPGVFIAGGAGITPFIAILRSLDKDKKLSGNKLIFSNKEKRDVILGREFKKMFANSSDLTLTLTRKKASGYEKGRIDPDFLKKYVNDFTQNFYICGPKQMVSDLKKMLKGLGAKTDTIVFEQ
jgi:ferredoxin-NADP reductase